MSRLDQFYRRLLLTKFFVKGWGNPENLKRIFEFRKVISCRDTCRHLVSPDHPVYIDYEEKYRDYKLIGGHFLSPLTLHMPGIMPKETETARFQMVIPVVWKSKRRPVCIHLAGTGDHFFWRRRTLLARPLLKEAGIASIILENPYYGYRKPKQQVRSSLHNVSDLFVMGGALVLESLVLLHWCTKQGYGPLGLTGISMGGHMASLAATNWHKPIVLVPCLSWSTASVVFTEGVMSGALPWKLLKEQFSKEISLYGNELSQLIQSPEKNMAFRLGSEFVKNYPESVKNLESLRNEFLSKDESDVSDFKNNNPPSSSLSSILHLKSFTDVLNLSAIFNFTSPTTTLSAAIKNHSSDAKPAYKPPVRPFGDEQTLDFMRGVMDECTHLGNFSVPVDTNLVIIVVARADAYYPQSTVLGLNELWPGSEIRYIDAGHISAYLLKQGVFRFAISDGFERYNEKYPTT
ncbi:hypothetical protein HELRODRAFT_67498 [Helobdella robusta]|uniref:Uncharacterized protein n=1 Tax=Helobdella robusta TaxID=6412 RepID=T1FZ19_HELRO|nr:hypothetical protein HELRODRAFT_67498 [Helobdella robusta]ESN99146.1 hypothetical protein HELRODRAFT_67498 [Helobdella robusta]